MIVVDRLTDCSFPLSVVNCSHVVVTFLLVSSNNTPSFLCPDFVLPVTLSCDNRNVGTTDQQQSTWNISLETFNIYKQRCIENKIRGL